MNEPNSSPGVAHRCPTCGDLRQYSFRFDAYYCRKCRRWLEMPCANPECIYCAQRPLAPPTNNPD